MIKEIEKGLYNAEFTPNTLGTAIRINTPPTGERRKELVKQVQKEGEARRSRSATSARTRTRKSPSWSRTRRSAKTRRSGEDDIQKLTDTNIKDARQGRCRQAKKNCCRSEVDAFSPTSVAGRPCPRHIAIIMDGAGAGHSSAVVRA